MPIQHYQAETYSARRSIGFLLKRAHLLLIDRLEPALLESGLTITQWVVMMHLREGLAVNATVLCTQLRHDSGALTRVLDQLETRGLIQRERSREDRRSVQLSLTPLGHSTLESLMSVVVETLNSTLGGLSRAEFTTLTRLLTKLIATLEGGAAPVAEADGSESARSLGPEQEPA